MFVALIGLISLWGGLLFGLDIGSMGGSVLLLKEEFQLPNSQIGTVVGSSLLGCALGAFFCGPLSSFLSRKWLIFLGALQYAVFALLLSHAESLNHLYLYRLMIGLGIGTLAFALPLYVGEHAPKEKRGALVSLYQLAITLGILGAFLLGAHHADQLAWRPLFFFNGTLALLFLVAIPFFPKSVKGVEKEESRLQALWKYRTPLAIGLTFGILQQFTGINAVIFYAPTILQQTGVEGHATLLLLSASIGVVNSLCTLVCIGMIDRWGRKPLLYLGLSMMLLSFLLLILAHTVTSWTLVSLMLFIAGFAFGIGPLFWVVCSEIFPAAVRGVGMSLATLVNWISNFIVSSTFLLLVDGAGWSGAFLVYGLICAGAILFVKGCVPETKGRSLESIEELWNVVKAPPG